MAVGKSALYQERSKSSVDISNISTSSQDKMGHLKISRSTSLGDSGGGIFDFYTGNLLGMMVGTENYGEKLGEYAGRGHIIQILLISVLGKFQPNWADFTSNFENA